MHGEQWRMAVKALIDVSSAIVSTVVLRQPKPPWVYEIASIRATMTEDGTGDLASLAMADGAAPSGLSNQDARVLTAHTADNGVNTFLHWGRTNQLGTQGMGSVDFPPEFFWAEEMHGWLQNGAGAEIVALFTVTYRIHRVQGDYSAAISKMLPHTMAKDREDFA